MGVFILVVYSELNFVYLEASQIMLTHFVWLLESSHMRENKAFRSQGSQFTSSLKLAFFRFAFHLFIIVPCGNNELALEIVDNPFAI